MTSIDLTSVQWRKSSYSSGTGQCVEVGQASDAVAIRDSKDPAGPALVVTEAAWASFVRGVAAGEFGQA